MSLGFSGRSFTRVSGKITGRFSRGIWVLTLLSFLNSAGLAISLPFLALYLYDQRGLSMLSVGLVILVAGLGSALAQIVGGVLSDRLGRRPLLVFPLLATTAFYLGMGALIAVSAPVLAIAAIYCLVRSMLMIVRPPIAAMIADLSPRDRLAESYGLLRVGQNLGWGAGPVIGGYLLTLLPYSWLFVFAAVIVFLALVLVLLALGESSPELSRTSSNLSVFSVVTNKQFVTFTFLSFLVFLVMSQMSSTLSVFTVNGLGFSTAQYGLLVGFNGLLVVVFQYPLARLLAPRRKIISLVLGGILYGAGYLSFGWISRFEMALVALFIISTGEIIFTPTAQTLVGELSPATWRGRYMGFFALSETLGLSFGPLMGGILLDKFTGQPPVLWGAISSVAFISGVGFLVAARAASAHAGLSPRVPNDSFLSQLSSKK